METPTEPLSMLQAYVLFRVTSAAWELRLPQILEEAGAAGLSVAEIARRLATKAVNGKKQLDDNVEEGNNSYREAQVDRILRFLAANGLLEQQIVKGDVIYSLAASSAGEDEEEEEDKPSPPSLHLVAHSNAALLHPYMDSKWSKLPEFLFHEHADDSLFSIFNADPAFRRSFNVAMTFFSTTYINAFCGLKNSSYDLDPNRVARTFVDVGGADGRLAARIARRYSHLTRVLNFDLPPVIAVAPHRPGVEHVEGDMLQCIPSADIILLSNVLHNWPDEDCIKTLQNCHESLTGCKKLVILEVVIENTISEELSISSARKKLTLDIQMMIITNSRGKERTRNDWDKILKAARFENYKIVALDGSAHSVIEASID